MVETHSIAIYDTQMTQGSQWRWFIHIYLLHQFADSFVLLYSIYSWLLQRFVEQITWLWNYRWLGAGQGAANIEDSIESQCCWYQHIVGDFGDIRHHIELVVQFCERISIQRMGRCIVLGRSNGCHCRIGIALQQYPHQCHPVHCELFGDMLWADGWTNTCWRSLVAASIEYTDFDCGQNVTSIHKLFKWQHRPIVSHHMLHAVLWLVGTNLHIHSRDWRYNHHTHVLRVNAYEWNYRAATVVLLECGHRRQEDGCEKQSSSYQSKGQSKEGWLSKTDWLSRWAGRFNSIGLGSIQ